MLPFYGSLNRRKIDFDEPYNALLLDFLLGVFRRICGQGEVW